MKRLLLIFLFLTTHLFAQDKSVFQLDSTFSGEIKNWKYHKGDDIKWAEPTLDDGKWITIPSNFNLGKIPKNEFETIGWFRLHIIVDTSLVNKTLGLMLTQAGASEVYLDGKFLYKFGSIDTKNPEKEERYDPQYLPVDIRFENTRNHLLAVRYANARAVSDFKKSEDDLPGFEIKIGNLRDKVEGKYIRSNIDTAVFIFYFTFFLALSFLHFMFFLFYRANKSNLYYSIFSFSFSFTFLWLVVRQNYLSPDVVSNFNFISLFLYDIYAPALLAMLYTIFNTKLPKIFWVWLALYFIDFLFSFFTIIGSKYMGMACLLIFAIESFRTIIVSIYKKREGAWIIGTGIIITILYMTTFSIWAAFGTISINFTGWLGAIVGLLFILCTLSIPLSMTIYLARDFSKTSKNLERKLIEVETLSEKTIEQEKEKQHILANQNVMLEQQVEERTSEIVEQKKVIEEKNKDITDSINYAKRIQDAILPDKEIKYKLFPDAFVLFKPKDIVSGDFYWFAEKNSKGAGVKKLIASVDCTGHGVPGALMSMIGSNIINQIVNEKNITSPEEILNNLHKEIRHALKQHDNTQSKDGMDIALCSFIDEKTLEYAGANRPLWIINTHGVTEIKADKFSIGGTQKEEERKFTKHTVNLNKGDCIYIFSDGYADQFGGLEEKKFMTRKFKELLLAIYTKPMGEQEIILDKTIEDWRGAYEQIDDILVIGIRV